MQTIGDRIRIIMDANNLKQTGLAEALQVNQSSVSMWLSGRSNPSAQTVQQICDKYGYNRDWLLNGVGEPRSLASDDQQVIDALAHAIKFKSTASDHLLRAVAATLAAPNGDLLLQAAVDFFQHLLDEYNAAHPSEAPAPTESDAPPDPDK